MKQKKRSAEKGLYRKQRRFADAVEAVGDILAFEAEYKNRARKVIKGTSQLASLVGALVSLRREDPQKFDQLNFPQDLLKLRNDAPDDADRRLRYFPEEYLICFSPALSQLLRVHEAAVDSGNTEVSVHSTGELINVLREISAESGNNLFVKEILGALIAMSRKAISAGDISAYEATAHWYPHLVFTGSWRTDRGLDLSYLRLFDEYFSSSLRFVIESNSFTVFKGIVKYLHDGCVVETYAPVSIYDYLKLIYDSAPDEYDSRERTLEISKSLRLLERRQECIYTRNELEKWCSDYRASTERLKPLLKDEFVGTAEEIDRKIVHFITERFKFNNLLEIVFGIGAYSVFKGRIHCISYLWNYKQPFDADASWGGHDVIPNSLKDVMDLYFSENALDRRHVRWDDHHGSELHFMRYFLLLLLRLFQKPGPPRLSPGEDQTPAAPERAPFYQGLDYSVPTGRPVYYYSRLEYEAERLVPVAKGLKQKVNTLSELGFKEEDVDALFDDCLVPFLEQLKVQAQRRMEVLSRELEPRASKIEDFKKDLLDGFNGSVHMRRIFEHFKLFVDNDAKVFPGKPRDFGIRQVDDKAVFFKEWHVSYLRWGSEYGGGLASSEDGVLAEQIARRCDDFSGRTVEEALGSHDDLSQVIMLVSHSALAGAFLRREDMHWHWQEDVPRLDLPGYKGCYEYKGCNIPVFVLPYRARVVKDVMIIDTANLGTFTQWSPLDEGEDKSLRRGIFRMDIRFFSMDEEVMKEFIDSPPPWLSEKGSEEEQRNYLMSHASIRVFERFTFEIDERFKGYILSVTD